MNITNGIILRECTSCQMCAAVCPKEAISIQLNRDGFYRPYVDESRCVDCGLCTKVCYKYDYNVKVTNEEEEEKIRVYAAQHKSQDLLNKVTSGGVADALAKELIAQGYTCIGVIYNDENHRAEDVVATKEKETDAFRGSKYIQSYTLDAFKTLVNNVRNTKFAVFGLPCHIYAVHQFLSLRKLRDNCLLIDLFCHGCPSMLVWNKYEQQIKEQVKHKKFDEVQFRSKVKGWGTFYVVVVVVEGVNAFISNPKKDEFYSIYFSDQVLNDACADCLLRSTMSYTDIRLGDFWGKRYLNDSKGVSAVAITSERGLRLFKSVKEKFKIEERTLKEVRAKQSYGHTYIPNVTLRARMLESLRDENKTIKEVEKMFFYSQGMGYKLKTWLKALNWYLPFDLVRFLKKHA